MFLLERYAPAQVRPTVYIHTVGCREVLPGIGLEFLPGGDGAEEVDATGVCGVDLESCIEQLLVFDQGDRAESLQSGT